MSNCPRIGIVGGGVVGMTAALSLCDQLRGVSVTVMADKFETETTSNVAAGIFRPGTSFSASDDAVTKQWVNDSWNHWSDLLKTSEAPLAGVTHLSGYIFSKTNPGNVRNHLIEDILPMYRRTTEEELQLCKGDWKYGSFYSTLLVECKLYLPWATKRFLSGGGIIKRREINSFSDICDDYDIILNCTGLGARELCNDLKLVPIRGQIIKVKAPWIKTAFSFDFDTYVIPGFEGVTLGGTRQYDSFNLDVCKYDAAAIMERSLQSLPSLKNAEVIRHAVGLRPHRSPVRVEGEVMQFGGKKAKVVHCYGHGGYGVTCAPGTAMHAVNIVKQFMKSSVGSKL